MKVAMSIAAAAAKIGDDAASVVEQCVLAWCRSHEDATAAEKREAAKLIIDGYVQGYDDVASELAAQWSRGFGRMSCTSDISGSRR